MRKTMFILLLALFAISAAFGQTVFYNETMGTVSGTTVIATHETNNGFSETTATYSGTADVRATGVSSGYTGASGSANVFFTNTVGKYLMVEGINSSAYSNITMTLGHYKSSTTANNELTIEVSSDGTNWTALSYTRPTGTGTASWVLVSPTGSIPSTGNLRIKFTQTSATPQFRVDDIKLAGTTGAPTPTITVNPATLTGFTYVVGSGTSAEQSFTVSGANLTTNISIAASTNYEISKTTGTGYATPLTFTPAEAATAQTVYVRLKAGLAVGTYNSEDIIATSTGADNKTVTCSGSVTSASPSGTTVNFDDDTKWTAASPTLITSYSSGHTYIDGVFSSTGGPALRNTNAAQDGFAGALGTYSWRLTNAACNWVATIASGGVSTFSVAIRRWDASPSPAYTLDYSIDGGTNWVNSATINNTTLGDTSNWTTFNGTINNANTNIQIRLNSTGSTERIMLDDFAWSGYAGTPTPTINVTGTLEAFSTYTGTPSAAQTYTVGGSNLTANIAIAAVTGFEYSTDGTNYSSTLSLAHTAGTVTTTTIYVRLTGATAGTPSGNIAHTSAGATQVDVAVSGTVTAPTPTITLSPADLNAFSAYVGTPSAPQTYTVAGVYLTADISIAAVSGFEYSTNGTSFSSTLSLAHTAGTVTTTTIYVRLTGTTLGDYSGTIVHTSTGATQQDKAVTGSVTAVPAAETFLEENFEYPAASLLTANGWTAHSGGGTNAFFVSNPGLSYTGYLANSGLCAETTGNNGEDVNRLFAAQTEGSIYASLLVNMSSAAVAGDYFFHLGANPLGSDFKGRVFAQRSAADSLLIRFGISRGGKVETAVWTGYTYSLNTTYLLVLKYTIVSGANNDQAVLWINPVIGATEPAYILASTDIAAADAANIGAVVLRQGNAANPTPVAKYDGLRVTSTWQQLWIATPTPVLHVDTVELDPLACIVNTPSDEIRSYTLYGEDTASQIEVTAPTGFQVSTSIDEGWDGSLHLSPAFSDTIYVRMFASVAGNYDDVITHTSGSAVHVYVAVSGECVAPAIVWNITQNLTAFSAQAGTASDNQQYTLSASNATGDIIVSTTAPFELSTTGVSGWNTELTLGYTFNGTIYVRMNATSAGSFTADITHTTDGASPNAISISGNATPAAGFAYDLFYSEYVYGSGNNKAIEIFNGTGATVDLHDYQYENWYNGGSSPSFVTFAVGTMLAHGETYVIANPTSSAAILAIANATSGNVSFNGDDALVLRKISTDAIVDIFGVIGQDPGTQWTADGGYTTLKKTLVRKSSVISGITVNPTISVPAVTTDFVTLATEWDMYDIDTITYLGSHTFGTGGTLATPVVVITQVGTDVVLTWEPITGAATYRVESSSDPYAADIDWTTETDADNTDETCTISASADKKFYRVIALP